MGQPQYSMNFDADILPSIVFGLFLAAALIAGLHMIRTETRSVGGAEKTIADLCFWLMVAAIAGARVGDLFYQPAAIFADPIDILRFWNGGSFYYSGVVTALIAGVYFIRHVGLPLWKTADMFAPTLAIGHFFVWMGCFFSGLCSARRAGAIIESLVAWPAESANRLSSISDSRSLFLAIGSFLIFLILLSLRTNKRFDGRMFWTFVTLHGMLQVLIDSLGFPGKTKLSAAIVSNPQIVGGIVALTGLSMLFYLGYRFQNVKNENTPGESSE